MLINEKYTNRHRLINISPSSLPSWKKVVASAGDGKSYDLTSRWMR